MQTEPKPSLPQRLLGRLSDAVYSYPRLFFYPQVVLFLVCVLYTVVKLDFTTNRDDLVGADKRYHRNFLTFKREFPPQDDLVVLVESNDPARNRRFVERLGARLEAETNLFTDVFFKGDLRMMGSKALLFVKEEDLRELHGQLKEFRPFLETFTQATNLASLFQLVNAQFRTAKREESAENKSLVKALPALERLVSEASDCLARPGTPGSPGIASFFGGGEEAEQEQYITYANGRIYLVTAHARTADLNADAVERLGELVRRTSVEVPGLNVGITGEPVLEVDEMKQSQEDTMVASMVSLVIVALIFIYGYQQTGRPLKATLCLVVGLGYTMGYTTLVVGHLNILTITFAPMLIGLAVDFGVHLVTRYEEELRHGRTEREALHKAMVHTGLGIFTGCLTTAGAFFAMAITNFRGIQEMGVIAGGGLLICLVPMLTLLPVLLLRGRQNVIDHAAPPAEAKRARIERAWLERPGLVLVVTVVLCGLSWSRFGRVPFDYNLLRMQADGLPAVVYEKKLLHSASNSLLYSAVIATNLQQAVALEAKLTNLTTVGMVRSMGQFLAENPAPKLQLIRDLKAELATMRFPRLDTNPVNVPELSQILYSLQGYLGLAEEEVRKENDLVLEQNLRKLRDAIQVLRTQILNAHRGSAPEKLAAFQQALLEDLHETLETMRGQDATAGLRVEDLPEPLRNRFIGRSGHLLLQVYPCVDVWQREGQRAFVDELRRTLDPEDSGHPIITGTPVQLLEYTTLLKRSYEEAALYALAAIALIVFAHFRSVGCVLLALLPVAIGAIWMVGFMGWVGIPFNPANIMTLPLVIGIGVSNGIHILNRFAEEQNPGILAKSTGKAVLVSGLTTVAGFGSLILAKHQGISSLGCIMAVGTTTCMVAALTFLPALLNLLVRRGWKIKGPSGDNALPPLGREEPR